MRSLELNGDNAADTALQDSMYLDAVKAYGTSLSRLVRGYERDASRQQDLMQDIHVALWKSLESFDGKCALQTWVYRVAHNVAIRHMTNRKRIRLRELHTLEEMPEPAADHDADLQHTRRESLRQLFELVEKLKPLDRQVILLYLEEQNAMTIADITGLSPENVATKIHRIKQLLRTMFRERGLL
ncbi:MAG: RNA polymerase sigma factor [Steroidobacter sp.]